MPDPRATQHDRFVADLNELVRGLDYGQGERILEYVEVGRALLKDAEHAIDGMLDWAHRHQGGDPTLDPEEYYAARDFARATLSKLRNPDA